jgi:hypothetical protein
MLSVSYAEYHIQALYAECHYAQCHYAKCRYAKLRGAFAKTNRGFLGQCPQTTFITVIFIQF